MADAPDPLTAAQAEFARTRDESKRLHREFIKAPLGSEMRKQLSKKHGDAARAHQRAVDALRALTEPRDPSSVKP